MVRGTRSFGTNGGEGVAPTAPTSFPGIASFGTAIRHPRHRSPTYRLDVSVAERFSRGDWRHDERTPECPTIQINRTKEIKTTSQTIPSGELPRTLDLTKGNLRAESAAGAGGGAAAAPAHSSSATNNSNPADSKHSRVSRPPNRPRGSSSHELSLTGRGGPRAGSARGKTTRVRVNPALEARNNLDSSSRVAVREAGHGRRCRRGHAGRGAMTTASAEWSPSALVQPRRRAGRREPAGGRSRNRDRSIRPSSRGQRRRLPEKSGVIADHGRVPPSGPRRRHRRRVACE